jgi:chaperonin GroEL
MAKHFKFGTDAKESISKGALTIARAVGTTFGANGQNVLIETFIEDETGNKVLDPKITKDGVTVARHCSLKDTAENTAAQSLIQVALKMLERVGDGTTTAILITEALIDLLLNYDLDHPQKQKIQEHVKNLIELFKKSAIKADADPKILEGIAHISSNGDEEITSLLKEAIRHVEGNGNILVEVQQALTTTISSEKGIYLPHGFASHEAVVDNTRRSSVEYRDPFVVLYNDKVESLTPLTALINNIHAKESFTPLVIIAKHISDDAQGMIAINSYKSGIRLAGISLDLADSECDALFEDLSVATGIPIYGTIAYKIFGDDHNGIRIGDLKKVSILRLNKDSTIIVPYSDNRDAIDDHLKNLEMAYEEEKSTSERERIKKRKARLSPNFAIIRIGGLTPQSIMEKKDRIEDAICAVMDARKNGAIPGAGAPLLMAIKYLDKFKDDSAEILQRVFFKLLCILFRKSHFFPQIRKKFDYLSLEDNSEHNTFNHTIDDEYGMMDLFMEKLNANKGYEWETPQKWNGINLAKDEIVNLCEANIFDPASVITIALETGLNSALNLINSGTIITLDRKLDLAASLAGMTPRNC